MHKLVATVFKILGGSILLMILLDAGLVVVDTVTVNTRVESMATVLQCEIAKHNCVPDAIIPLFDKQLRFIEDNSDIATSVQSNIKGNLKSDSKLLPEIGESNVKDYGEVQTLGIVIEMSPSIVVFSGSGKDSVRSVDELEKRKGGSLSYTLNYEYTIPCLRYLK